MGHGHRYGSRTILFIDPLALRPFGGGGVSFSPLLRAGLRAGLVLRDTEGHTHRHTPSAILTPAGKHSYSPDFHGLQVFRPRTSFVQGPSNRPFR